MDLKANLQDSFNKFSNNTAICIQDKSITYAQLESKSKTLANILQNQNSVLLLGYRSFEVYISICACVLANTTYIPLNPKFPKERLLNIISRVDTNAIILCKECIESFSNIAPYIKPLDIYYFDKEVEILAQDFKEHNFICVKNAKDSTKQNSSENAAYLLFTSGSTGIPKGVLVSQNNLYAYILQMKQRYNFTPEDRISQFFDITFDLSMHDIFCTFLSGATLVVIPHTYLINPIKYLRVQNVSVFFAPPSLIAMLLRLKALKDSLDELRISLFCGEALPFKSAFAWSKFAPNSLIDNLYGPTEATIAFSVFSFVQEGGSAKNAPKEIDYLNGILPLGLPFPNLKISLRQNGKEVKEGEVGEIYLGGAENKNLCQIAIGYYKDEQKTKEKFIQEKGVRWYKTGDLGVFDKNLNAYCFLGRIDEQVKIQGFRVELLEIDGALESISGKQARAVVIEQNNLNSIYGVIEGDFSDEDATKLLESLKEKLPFYALPVRIITIPNFPLNANGKIDRNAIKNIILQLIKNGGGNMGKIMLSLAHKLFRIPRSLSGDGNRKTLQIIQEHLSKAKIDIFEIPSKTKAFDWEIPLEWNIKDAYIITPNGEKICDFKENALHIVGYSTPQDLELCFNELEPHLYTLENEPEAIPYITSYYKERFGFCLKHTQFLELKQTYENSNEKFKIKIDSTLKEGSLTYGEIFIQGKSEKEMILSTYICHPQMANNEISGMLVAHALAEVLSARENRYSYRILLMPETIGSIYYLSRNLKRLKEVCVAGFVLTCLGDNRKFSALHSRSADNVADRAASHILKFLQKEGKEVSEYSYLERGSDERQYCAPGVDLPFCTLMRTKFGEFREYHTSLDDLSLLSEQSLNDSLEYVLSVLKAVELNGVYENTILCEPKLDKYGLYPTLSTKETFTKIRDMRNLLMYCDGKLDLLQIAEICGFNLLELEEYLEKFIKSGLLKEKI